jgi:hypothetical protein
VKAHGRAWDRQQPDRRRHLLDSVPFNRGLQQAVQHRDDVVHRLWTPLLKLHFEPLHGLDSIHPNDRFISRAFVEYLEESGMAYRERIALAAIEHAGRLLRTICAHAIGWQVWRPKVKEPSRFGCCVTFGADEGTRTSISVHRLLADDTIDEDFDEPIVRFSTQGDLDADKILSAVRRQAKKWKIV